MSLLDFIPLYIPHGISFSSDWYYYNAGTDMSEETMKDPAKRLENAIKNMRYREERYPEIFMPDGKPRSEQSCNPGLGHGVTTVASMLGANVKYVPHLDPQSVPSVDVFKIDPVKDFKVPDIQDAMEPIFKEIDMILDMGFSKSQIGFPNLQGPLNIAFETLGDNQMMKLLVNKKKEEQVKHILEVTSDTFLEAHKALRKELKRSSRGGWTTAGCTYVYLSPRTFRKFVVPIIEKCAKELGPVGLHHCGVANHDQLDAYSEVDFTGVEFGFGTDIHHARVNFLNNERGLINISCRMSPYRMLNQSAEQIKKDIEWLIEVGKGGPQSINVVGCPHGTPDENVFAYWNTIEEYNHRKEEEEEEDW
ncbi:MAG: uroporphyrinogen decarboxylase family protein [Candidatus Hodarchaeota archaeon]